MRGGKDTGGKKERDRFYVASLARECTDEAIQLLKDTMSDTKVDHAVRLRAADLLLERGWGKAPVEINIGTQEDGVKFIFEVRHFDALSLPSPAVALPAGGITLTLDAATGVHQHELATTPARGQS